MSDEDTRPDAQPGHAFGQSLDELSVAELGERIALLHREIARLETAVTAKQGARGAALAFFSTKAIATD